MKALERFKDLFRDLGHDPVIDALRALSVLMIVAFHVAIGIMQVYSPDQVKDYLLSMPALLQPLFHGEKGVDAFFLISALVLGLPLFKNLESFNLSKAWSFYQARFFRIYPLFFVCLILYAIPQWNYFGRYFWTNLFLINNLWPDHRSIIPVGWSLVVEVQYYLMLPLLLFGLKKLKSQFQLSFLILLSFSSIFVCAWILVQNPSLYQRPLTDLFFSSDKSDFTKLFSANLYESLIARYGPFALGLTLAFLKVKKDKSLTQFFSSRLRSSIVRILALVFILTPLTLPIHHPASWYYNEFNSILNFWVLASSRQVFALGLVLLILGCWYAPQQFFVWKKFFSLSFWRPISRLSFPIYLLHFPMIAVSAVILKGTTDVKEIGLFTFTDAGIVFLTAILLTVLISIPLHLWIERPAIDYFKAKKRAIVK